MVLCFNYNVVTVYVVYNQGRIQDFSKGGSCTNKYTSNIHMTMRSYSSLYHVAICTYVASYIRNYNSFHLATAFPGYSLYVLISTFCETKLHANSKGSGGMPLGNF